MNFCIKGDLSSSIYALFHSQRSESLAIHAYLCFNQIYFAFVEVVAVVQPVPHLLFEG